MLYISILFSNCQVSPGLTSFLVRSFATVSACEEQLVLLHDFAEGRSVRGCLATATLLSPQPWTGKNVTKRYRTVRHGFFARGAIKDGQFKVG